jgi:hypothetical protein
MRGPLSILLDFGFVPENLSTQSLGLLCNEWFVGVTEFDLDRLIDALEQV